MPTRKSGSSGRSSSSRSSSSNSSSSTGGGRSAAEAQVTRDHETIRRWAEEKGGQPACVRGTRGKGDSCLLRIDFPGGAGKESLEEIPWEQFFKTFDENGLVFLYQDKTKTGRVSRFNKFVSGDTVQKGESRRKAK
jgi:hypothetical protein